MAGAENWRLALAGRTVPPDWLMNVHSIVRTPLVAEYVPKLLNVPAPLRDESWDHVDPARLLTTPPVPMTLFTTPPRVVSVPTSVSALMLAVLFPTTVRPAGIVTPDRNTPLVVSVNGPPVAGAARLAPTIVSPLMVMSRSRVMVPAMAEAL